MKQAFNHTVENELPAEKAIDMVAPLQSYRGLKACLRDGWRIFALNAKKYILQLLPAALLVGVVSSLVLGFFYYIGLKHLVPIYVLTRGGNDPVLVNNTFGISNTLNFALLAALLIGLVAWMAARGVVWRQIQVFQQTDSLPEQRFLWLSKEVRRQKNRCLVYDAISVVPVILLLVLLVYLHLKWWVSLSILLVVAVILDNVMVAGCYLYMIEGRNLKQSLKYAFHRGIRQWGGYFTLSLMTSIPVGAVAVGLLIAVVPYALGGVFNAMGMVIGEPSGMPLYATIINCVALLIGLTISFLMTTLQTWTLAFRVASNIKNENSEEKI